MHESVRAAITQMTEDNGTVAHTHTHTHLLAAVTTQRIDSEVCFLFAVKCISERN